jgi:hypothetical protein
MISTVLTLIVVPVVYYAWDGWHEKRRRKREFLQELKNNDSNTPDFTDNAPPSAP